MSTASAFAAACASRSAMPPSSNSGSSASTYVCSMRTGRERSYSASRRLAACAAAAARDADSAATAASSAETSFAFKRPISRICASKTRSSSSLAILRSRASTSRNHHSSSVPSGRSEYESRGSGAGGVASRVFSEAGRPDAPRNGSCSETCDSVEGTSSLARFLSDPVTLDPPGVPGVVTRIAGVVPRGVDVPLETPPLETKLDARFKPVCFRGFRRLYSACSASKRSSASAKSRLNSRSSFWFCASHASRFLRAASSSSWKAEHAARVFSRVSRAASTASASLSSSRSSSCSAVSTSHASATTSASISATRWSVASFWTRNSASISSWRTTVSADSSCRRTSSAASRTRRFASSSRYTLALFSNSRPCFRCSSFQSSLSISIIQSGLGSSSGTPTSSAFSRRPPIISRNARSSGGFSPFARMRSRSASAAASAAARSSGESQRVDLSSESLTLSTYSSCSILSTTHSNRGASSSVCPASSLRMSTMRALISAILSTNFCFSASVDANDSLNAAFASRTVICSSENCEIFRRGGYSALGSYRHAS
mmetsp:Transcript_10910/g.46577  ORF Transcript_10910/g.46577 Transcript_10910/m.46577 type:complete len:546 (-) Transcript_10910:747-2384(-)